MSQQGLTQADLDFLSVSAEDCEESPPSPLDEQLLRLKKHKRRISFSAITAEIAAVITGDPSEQRLSNGGLSQEELDALSIEGPSEGMCEPSSPLDSMLHAVKRRRSVGDGAAGALARASELVSSTAGITSVAGTSSQGFTGDFSQAAHDKLGVVAAGAENREEEAAKVPAKSEEECIAPPPKRGVCGTPPRKKGAGETKVPGAKSPDSSILGSPFSKSPESSKTHKSEDSGMQRSPLGSINREF